MRSVLAAGAVIIALTLAGFAPAAAAPPLLRVTVIADSAFTAVIGNQEPLAILKGGFETDIDVGVCRRLTGTSCPSDGGVELPRLVDVVQSLGSTIAPTVVVEVGYNEFVDTFPQSVEVAITTLLAAGVTKILWTTMAEWRPQYVPMNQVLVAAAGRHPELELVDWAATSRGHDSWFQGDGVHLTYEGALGIAHLLHDALMDALIPPLIATPTHLQIAHVGRPYSAQFSARGGITPYRWRLTSGRLTNGLHLLSSGPRDRNPSPVRQACPHTPHHRCGRTGNKHERDDHDRPPVGPSPRDIFVGGTFPNTGANSIYPRRVVNRCRLLAIGPGLTFSRAFVAQGAAL